ncbi:MAG TPA: hypothetical protein VEJ45_10035 [Candidatus Acidoferrales bacterium]|nr:hypothetical protein [Candidatus Acidoferrales bacterium]
MVVATAILALTSLTSFARRSPTQAASRDTASGSSDAPAINPQGTAPSPEEVRARADTFVANQHRDDQAREQYERVERYVDRTAGSMPRTIDDKVYRIVPTGAGTAKILLRDGDKPVDPATYRHEMQNLEDLLQAMANPNDSRAKAAYAKRQKHESDRAEFVDAAKEAFTIRWLGTSTVHERACDVFELDPNQDFRPHGLFQEAFLHVVARIWVDKETTQMAYGDARVTSDVSFGGGILGKLYRGGVVSMEQTEAAPGIWLPTHYQYDYSGRKFLFFFEQHQSIDASHYHRVGTPEQVLALVKSELANGKSFLLDP